MRRVFFVVTVCLESKRRRNTSREKKIRENQYKEGIRRVLNWAQKRLNVQVILVENNGKRRTFLDTFGIPVLYTTNNDLKTKNIGTKELQDVRDCIKHFKMEDDDFLVKMTGRYHLHTNSKFLTCVENLEKSGSECILRYGTFKDIREGKRITTAKECNTGLIGMAVKHVKKIPFPRNNVEWVEWCWAKLSHTIPKEKKTVLCEPLGIWVCPSSNSYFLA